MAAYRMRPGTDPIRLGGCLPGTVPYPRLDDLWLGPGRGDRGMWIRAAVYFEERSDHLESSRRKLVARHLKQRTHLLFKADLAAY